MRLSGYSFCFVLIGMFSGTNAQTVLDPEPLRHYISIALDSNGTIKQEKEELQKAKAQNRVSVGNYFPSLSLESRYTRAGGGRSIDLPIGDLLNPVYQNLNQNLPPDQQIPLVQNQEIFFVRPHEQQSFLRLAIPVVQPKIWFGHSATKALVKSHKHAFSTQARETMRDTRIAYYRYAQALEAVLLRKAEMTAIEESYRVAKSSHAAGSLAPPLLASARAEYASVKHDLSKSENDMLTAKQAFNLVTGRDLDDTVETVSLEQMLDMVNKGESSSDIWVESAMENSGEIQKIEASIEALEARKKVEYSNAWPVLNAVLDAGIQGETYTFARENRYYMASAVLSWQLFSGGNTYAKASQVKAEIRQARHGLKQLRQGLTFKTKKAFREYLIAREGLQPAREKVRAAVENLRQAEGRQSIGSASPSEVIAARQQKVMAESGEKLAIAEVLIQYAKLRYLSAIEPVW